MIYDVVVCTSVLSVADAVKGLTTGVNSSIKNGFVPIGGVSTIVSVVSSSHQAVGMQPMRMNTYTASQAMVKKETSDLV